MIIILREFYEKVYVIKPLMSRPSNSEKYLVCMNFKYNSKDSEYNKRINILESILQESHKNSEANLLDIFPDYEPDQDIIKYMTKVNLYIANRQFRAINEIIDFLNKQNFYGDVYQLSRQHQIEANKYWISMFYPATSKLNESEKKLREILKKQLHESNQEVNKLYSQLSY